MVIDKKYLMVAGGIVITIITSIAAYLWFTHSVAPKELPAKVPIKLQSTTEVTAVQKVSPDDNDLEVTQVYRAEINGAKVEIPVATKENIKGVVKQEIDMTPVLQMQRELDKNEFKKNWELSTGVGVENGQLYIPIGIQRNYAADKAIAIEIHQDAKDIKKTTGAEVKHVWLIK